MTPSQRDALCQELIEALRATPATGEDPLALVTGALPPLPLVEPEVGQLWRAAQAAGDRQVLNALTHVSGVIRAVLATEDTWLAAPDDVILPGEASPTGAALALLPSTDLPVPR